MIAPRLLASVLALALCPLSLAAQAPHLSKSGGAAPGATTFTVTGAPGELYGVILATSEAPTPVLPGVTLDVTLDLLPLSFAIPGLVGVLGPAGSASATVVAPGPGPAGMTISAQALAGPGFNAPSNLVRVTLAAPGTFAPTLDAPVAPIAGGAYAVEASGDLVFAGGSGPLAQRYRPDREEWEAAGVSIGVGLLSQATGLADGRVLFTGGLDLAGQPTDAAAVWDPVTGATTTLAMGAKRAGHQAARLPDGRVLVTGGFGVLSLDFAALLADPLQLFAIFDGLLASTEFFDPATSGFSPGPAMLEPRALHTATTTSTGSVLVAGGLSKIPILNLPTVSSTAYAYDPVLGIFGLPKLFDGGRMLHSAVALADGSVLMVGGLSLDLSAFLTTLDPATLALGTRDDVQRYTAGFFGGGFSQVGTLSEPRAGAGLALLPDGRVLIAGGLRAGLSTAGADFQLTGTADVYQLGTGVQATGAMGAARVLPLLAPLADATVLVVGGGAPDAEVYQP